MVIGGVFKTTPPDTLVSSTAKDAENSNSVASAEQDLNNENQDDNDSKHSTVPPKSSESSKTNKADSENMSTTVSSEQEKKLTTVSSQAKDLSSSSAPKKNGKKPASTPKSNVAADSTKTPKSDSEKPTATPKSSKKPTDADKDKSTKNQNGNNTKAPKKTTPEETEITTSSQKISTTDAPIKGGGSIGSGGSSILPGWFEPKENKQIILVKDDKKEDDVLPMEIKSSFALSEKERINLKLKRIENIKAYPTVIDEEKDKKVLQQLFPTKIQGERHYDYNLGVYQDVENKAAMIVTGARRKKTTVRYMVSKKHNKISN